MGGLDPSATLVDAIAADAIAEPPAGAQAGEPVAAAGAARTGRFVLFTIAGAHYAVPESYVTEIERVPKVTLVPGVPAWLRGVANLRGDIVSVVDLRVFVGMDPTSPHTGRMIVARLLDEEFSAGLLVDGVGQMVTVPIDDIRPPASPLEGPLAGYLVGIAVIGERIVASLDLDRLLRSPEIRQFDDPKETRNPSCEAS